MILKPYPESPNEMAISKSFASNPRGINNFSLRNICLHNNRTFVHQTHARSTEDYFLSSYSPSLHLSARLITSSFNSRRTDSRGLEMQIKRDKENTAGHYRASEVSSPRTERKGRECGNERERTMRAENKSVMDDRSSLDCDGA